MKAVAHSLPYQRELDGLRGIAILLVVWSHLWPDVFGFGYVGVDVFFVLSGYLITKVIVARSEAGRFSLLEFYRNRVRRIFPAMALVLLAALIGGYLFLFPTELSQLGAHVSSSAFFFENARLRSQTGYWDLDAQLKPLMHFWSLSIEEQFYLFWPLLVTMILSNGIARYAGLAVILVLALFPVTQPAKPFFYSLARFWELAIGGGVVWVERKWDIGALLTRRSVLPPLIFTLALALANGMPGYRLSVLAVITGATAIWLMRLGRNSDRLLSNRVLVFFGLISFPLYLWHFPIVSFLTIVGIAPSEHAKMIFAIAVLLSYGTHRFIESPARRQTNPAFILGLVLIVVMIGAIGVYVARNGGLPDRPQVRTAREMETQFQRGPDTDPNCDALSRKFLAAARLFRFCRATSANDSLPYIAIVGDSHARAAFAGFASELVSRHVETLLLANSGCAAFVDGAEGRDLADMEACQRQIDQVYELLAHMKHLSGVILAARGPRYMTDTGYGPPERSEHGEIHYRRTLELGAAYPRDVEYLRAIESSIRYLSARGIPVYVLLENPELGFLPTRCLERPFGIAPKRCAVSYEAYSERMRDYRSRVAELVRRMPGAALLDPEPAFCDKTECHAVRDGQMLYADDDHLSMRGSERQARELIGRVAVAR